MGEWLRRFLAAHHAFQGVAEGPEPWDARREATRWLPPAELAETRDNLFLPVELPGIEAKDLDIAVQDRTVVIKGEKQALNQGGVAVRFSDLDYGPFEREVSLPSAAVPEGVMATLVRGVLILTIPKRQGEEEPPDGDERIPAKNLG